jgi:Tfp pilus assembly protein PilO
VSLALVWCGSKGAARLQKPWEKTLFYPLRRFGENTPSHAIMADVTQTASDVVSTATGIDPLLLSAIVAVVAYLFQFMGSTYLSHEETKKEKRRLRNEHELTRIDYQLSTVFGPMRGLLLSSKAAFTILVTRWKCESDVPGFISKVEAPISTGSPSALQKDWMLWIEHILQPSNRQLCDAILQHSNGFDTIPGFLANVVASTKEFEVILAKWSAGDHSHMNTTVPFDDRINAFVESEFKRLRTRKMAILEAMDVEHSLPGAQELERDDAGITLTGETRGNADTAMLRGRDGERRIPVASMHA